MTGPVTQLALCSALALSPADDGGAPEWLHLLPAGGVVATVDGRGPYKVGNYHALMAASLPQGQKLVLDENHSTDLAAPKGLPAPARGWIVELQQRQDGIWGKVEWTEEGRKLASAYRGVSPVIAHRKDKTIVAIRRASLVNQPNLEGLTSLHSEENEMALKEMLVEALNLAESADDETIVAAVKKAVGGVSEAAQAALAPIAEKLGVAADADLVGTIDALQAAKKPDDEVVVALQSELAGVTETLNALRESTLRKDATAFVDGAIAEGRVGVKPLRDEYIAMHMEDAARTEKLIGAMPKVGGQIPARDPQTRSAELSDADKSVIALCGIDPDKFKETRQAELGVEEEAL
ncbi:MAG: hypothetical protein J0I69_02780 [Altererythrobacter sp.]|nr:hypothetical protein [Altererythrobacter sp.]OJU60944.1 MAG: hypothetical protein BGO08_12525 [Altererythrobacter sp. 66-12]